MFGLNWIDVGIIALYFGVTVAVGLRAKSAVKTSGDYFMGGRSFGKLMMVAQAFGAGTRTDQVVAVVGASYQLGLAGIWYQWLYIFATPFFWIIAPIYRRLRYVTIGDFFEQRYSASMAAAYTTAGLCYFAVEIGIILKGTGVTISAVTKGALSTEATVLAMVAFFLSYSLVGGLAASAGTKLVQGMLILLLSFMLIPFAIDAAGGIEAAREKLPDEMFSLIAPNEVTLFFIVMSVINGLVGIVVYPHHMAINGAGKTEESCRSGWTFGTFIKRFATLGWAFTGVFLAAIFSELPNREQAFGAAVQRLLPTGFIGLMIAAMVAAVVSACDAYMIAGSALFTRNFYQKFFNQNLSESESLVVARASSVGLVAVGVVVALAIPSVVEGLKFVWKLMAFLGVAFWMGVVWRRANAIGAWASLIVTASVSLVTGALGWSLEYQAALYLPLGFLSLVATSLATPPEPEEKLTNFYTLLHTPVGEEHKLAAANVPVTLSGDSAKENSANKGDSLEENGQSLLIVDLLSLRKTFSLKRYRVDVQGFALGALATAGILGLAVLMAKAI